MGETVALRIPVAYMSVNRCIGSPSSVSGGVGGQVVTVAVQTREGVVRVEGGGGEAGGRGGRRRYV